MLSASSNRTRIGTPRVFAPGAPVSEFLLVLFLSAAIGAGALAARQPTAARLAVGALGGVIFFVMAASGRVTALRLVVIFLVLLGFIRRLLIPFAGWSPQDPLLLVSPACALLVWLNGRKQAPQKLDATTVCGLFFLWAVIGAVVNPLQGSLNNGLTGALFWFPPVLWLFAGRTFNLSIHRQVLNIIGWLAIPVALHGLRQTYFGLLSFEYTWVGVSGFGESIFFEGFRVRPFSTLVSPEEYGAFLGLSCMIWWGKILSESRYRITRLAIFGLLVWALFLQGSRGIFAFFLMAVLVTLFVKFRGVAPRLFLVGAVVAAVWFASQLEPPARDKKEDSTAGSAAAHQLQGLLDPTSSESTGPIHLQLIRDGFETAWENPLGLGTAPTSLVAKKSTDTRYASTENDLSTVFVTLGIPGGVIFTFFLAFMHASANRRFRAYRNWYTLAVVGIFVAATSRVWSGGMYTVASLIWFTIGGLSRAYAEADPAAELDEEPVGEEPAPAIAPEPAYAGG